MGIQGINGSILSRETKGGVMNWLLFFYAILITFGIVGGIILVGWLIAKYEEEAHTAILVLVSIAVFAITAYGVYLLLGR